MSRRRLISSFFFFNDTATTEIYTLSLHDALPIYADPLLLRLSALDAARRVGRPLHRPAREPEDRKSTRLNSSHLVISYAVFCLKKKKYFTHHRPHTHRSPLTAPSHQTPQLSPTGL